MTQKLQRDLTEQKPGQDLITLLRLASIRKQNLQEGKCQMNDSFGTYFRQGNYSLQGALHSHFTFAAA